MWITNTQHLCVELHVLSAELPHVWHQQAEISSLQQLLLSKNAEIESLHTQLLARPSLSTESSERGKHSTSLHSLHNQPTTV